MNHFFVITNKPKDEKLEITNHIVTFLRERGKICEFRFLEEAEGEPEKDNPNPLHIDEKTECIIVVGGDGTLLQAARQTLYLSIPLIGINYGTLGFLAEVEKSNLEEALLVLMDKKPATEKRMMLLGRVMKQDGDVLADRVMKQDGDVLADHVMKQDGEVLRDHALNDIVLTRRGSLQILNFDIYVNGQYLNQYSADGVIVSTPTGSTGYNMSAGGPIVEPKAELLLVTPICPHTLNTRSIILSADDIIEVRIPEGKYGQVQEVEVNFDGNKKEILRTNESIFITKSKKTTEFIRINQVSFLEVLHQKMSE